MASPTCDDLADYLDFLDAEPLNTRRRELPDDMGSIVSSTTIEFQRESLGNSPRNARLIDVPEDEGPPPSFRGAGDDRSENSDESTDGGDALEARPPTERRRRTRELRARRQACAMAIFLALAALSGAVVCLVLGEEGDVPAKRRGRVERRTSPEGGGAGAVGAVRVSQWEHNRRAQAEANLRAQAMIDRVIEMDRREDQVGADRLNDGGRREASAQRRAIAANARADRLNKRARREERARADRLNAGARHEPAARRRATAEGHYNAPDGQGHSGQEQDFLVQEGQGQFIHDKRGWINQQQPQVYDHQEYPQAFQKQGDPHQDYLRAAPREYHHFGTAGAGGQ